MPDLVLILAVMASSPDLVLILAVMASSPDLVPILVVMTSSPNLVLIHNSKGCAQSKIVNFADLTMSVAEKGGNKVVRGVRPRWQLDFSQRWGGYLWIRKLYFIDVTLQFGKMWVMSWPQVNNTW